MRRVRQAQRCRRVAVRPVRDRCCESDTDSQCVKASASCCTCRRHSSCCPSAKHTVRPDGRRSRNGRCCGPANPQDRACDRGSHSCRRRLLDSQADPQRVPVHRRLGLPGAGRNRDGYTRPLAAVAWDASLWRRSGASLPRSLAPPGGAPFLEGCGASLLTSRMRRGTDRSMNGGPRARRPVSLLCTCGALARPRAPALFLVAARSALPGPQRDTQISRRSAQRARSRLLP